MQLTAPGFILTSLSLKLAEKKEKTKQPTQNQYNARSSIAKFDYCLPPDGQIENTPANNSVG